MLAVSGVCQIIIFTLFIYLEKGSLIALKNCLEHHIVNDYKSTLMMSIPPLLLVNSYALLYLSVSIVPGVALQSYNYNIFGVAIFAFLVLKKRFFLSQILALYFIAKGLTFYPLKADMQQFDYVQQQETVFTIYGWIYVVLSVLAYGLSFIMLERILKSSEVSLWIRGIQLNIFSVPLALAVNYYFASSDPDHGFFDNFNIIAYFFVVFKIAEQMMELFVIKVADSVCRMLALSAAVAIVGTMKQPFDVKGLSPSNLGIALILAGICLYSVMEHFPKWRELTMREHAEEENEETDFKIAPPSYNEASKGYTSICVPSVSSKVSRMNENAETFLNLIDDPRDSS